MYSSDYFPSNWQKFGEVDLTFPAVDSTAIIGQTPPRCKQLLYKIIKASE